MVDEIKYWEEIIAWFVLVFTIYPFIKDYLTEKSGLSFDGNISVVAILAATIFGAFLLWLAKLQLSHFKKKEMDNIFNENFD